MNNDLLDFSQLSPTSLAEVLTRDRIMDMGIRPLWNGMPRIAGPAYTVRCDAGDHLMMHAAVYRAPPGSIIVVQAGDWDYAIAGGNVCAVAQKRGIVGLVVDGVIRDIGQTRSNHFPVFARGIVPFPGSKNGLGDLNKPIRCGNVPVESGDILVADEEGIVVVPQGLQLEVYQSALARAAKDASEPLEVWERHHRSRIEARLHDKGWNDEEGLWLS